MTTSGSGTKYEILRQYTGHGTLTLGSLRGAVCEAAEEVRKGRGHIGFRLGMTLGAAKVLADFITEHDALAREINEGNDANTALYFDVRDQMETQLPANMLANVTGSQTIGRDARAILDQGFDGFMEWYSEPAMTF